MIKMIISYVIDIAAIVGFIGAFSYINKVSEEYKDVAKELNLWNIANIIPAIVVILMLVLNVVSTWNHLGYEYIADAGVILAVVYMVVRTYCIKQKVSKLK